MVAYDKLLTVTSLPQNAYFLVSSLLFYSKLLYENCKVIDYHMTFTVFILVIKYLFDEKK